MNKVYLIYYTGWDEYHPELMAIKTTEQKVENYISELIARESWDIDDFDIQDWEVE